MRRMVVFSMLVALAASAAHASTSTQTKKYVGYGEPVTVSHCGGGILGDPLGDNEVGIGGVCYREFSGTEVSITIADMLAPQVAAHYSVVAADGLTGLAEGTFCGSKTISLPPGSTWLIVAIAGAGSMPCGGPTLASTGTVTASFSG